MGLTIGNQVGIGTVRQGAFAPVGYELLRDSAGIALKDSSGEFIYILIS